MKDYSNINITKIYIRHCHDSKDYMIEQCRVVMEPYGYHVNGEQKTSPKKWYGKEIDI